jgi:succinoglycan biosynthesis protein ExoV
MRFEPRALVDGPEGPALHAWMWRELFPALFDGEDDGIHFVAAGSSLNQGSPRTGLNVVLGAGAGPGAAAVVQQAAARWRIYGVRGPLSANLLGLQAEAVLTDPAVLLAGHPRWQQRAADGAGCLFVPRGPSARLGWWSAACAMVGIDIVDPQDDARARIDRIARARLVITESLQAAVVADALRVPWIPIVLSREVPAFSWADWAATVGVEYAPLLLAPSSPLEALRAALVAHGSSARIGAFHDQARRGAGPRELAWTREQLLQERSAWVARSAQAWRRQCSRAASTALDAAGSLVRSAQQRMQPGQTGRYLERAAEQLRQVQMAPAQLSSDRLHRRGLARCHDAVARLQADSRAGAFAAWRPAPAQRPGALQPGDFATP